MISIFIHGCEVKVIYLLSIIKVYKVSYSSTHRVVTQIFILHAHTHTHTHILCRSGTFFRFFDFLHHLHYSRM
jgi:hypothetical protein